MKKTKLPQNNEPLVKEEEQDKLINKYLSKEEVEDLMKEGFSKDQIAYVARERKKARDKGKFLKQFWIFCHGLFHRMKF